MTATHACFIPSYWIVHSSKSGCKQKSQMAKWQGKLFLVHDIRASKPPAPHEANHYNMWDTCWGFWYSYDCESPHQTPNPNPSLILTLTLVLDTEVSVDQIPSNLHSARRCQQHRCLGLWEHVGKAVPFWEQSKQKCKKISHNLTPNFNDNGKIRNR